MNADLIETEVPAPVPAAAITPLAAMDLITLSPETFTAAVYEPFKSRLTLAIEGVRAVEYDIQTTAGMKTALECRALFRSVRVDAEKERKARKAPITAIGKLLEAGYATIEASILPLEAFFDDDIDGENERKKAVKLAEENAEIARQAAIWDAITEIRQRETDVVRVCKTAAETQEAIDRLEAHAITKDVFQDRQGEAEIVKAETLASMRAILNTRAEAEAETARILAERATDDQRRAEESARIAADMRELAALRAANAEAKRVEQAKLDVQRKEQDEAAAALAASQAAFAAQVKAHQDEIDRAAKVKADAKAATIAAQAAVQASNAAFALRKEQNAALLAETEARALAAPVKPAKVDPMAEYAASIQKSEDRAVAEQRFHRPAAPVVPAAKVVDEPRNPGVYSFVALVSEHYGVSMPQALEWLRDADFFNYENNQEAA